MPVFGADPDSEGSEWEDVPVQQRYVSKPVKDLTNYFAYHRNMRMSQRFSDSDRSMLNILFSRRLKQGFSPDSLRSLIDRFYQLPESQADYPAPMFCKSDVQSNLIDDAKVVHRDATLNWLLEGMPNTFSHDIAPGVIRKYITLYSDQSMLRYPDVISEIIKRNTDSESLEEQLIALESLIEWNLGSTDYSVTELHATLSGVPLPTELRSKVRSPKSLRKQHRTVAEAVIFVPMRKATP